MARKKPSKRHQERLAAINDFRQLVRRNSERYYKALAERTQAERR